MLRLNLDHFVWLERSDLHVLDPESEIFLDPVLFLPFKSHTPPLSCQYMFFIYCVGPSFTQSMSFSFVVMKTSRHSVKKRNSGWPAPCRDQAFTKEFFVQERVVEKRTIVLFTQLPPLSVFQIFFP